MQEMDEYNVRQTWIQIDTTDHVSKKYKKKSPIDLYFNLIHYIHQLPPRDQKSFYRGGKVSRDSLTGKRCFGLKEDNENE